MSGGKAITIATALASGLFLSSAWAQAQPGSKIPSVGFIQSSRAPGDTSVQYDAFIAGLRDLGYVEGKDVHIESRYAERAWDELNAAANFDTGFHFSGTVASQLDETAGHERVLVSGTCRAETGKDFHLRQ